MKRLVILVMLGAAALSADPEFTTDGQLKRPRLSRVDLFELRPRMIYGPAATANPNPPSTTFS